MKYWLFFYNQLIKLEKWFVRDFAAKHGCKGFCNQIVWCLYRKITTQKALIIKMQFKLTFSFWYHNLFTLKTQTQDFANIQLKFSPSCHPNCKGWRRCILHNKKWDYNNNILFKIMLIHLTKSKMFSKLIPNESVFWWNTNLHNGCHGYIASFGWT